MVEVNFLFRYLSGIFATPDIWPEEYPEEIEKKERNKP